MTPIDDVRPGLVRRLDDLEYHQMRGRLVEADIRIPAPRSVLTR
jgi:hypothetical protein